MMSARTALLCGVPDAVEGEKERGLAVAGWEPTKPWWESLLLWILDVGLVLVLLEAEGVREADGRRLAFSWFTRDVDVVCVWV